MRQIRVRERAREVAPEKHAINEQILAPEVRVIGVDGAQLGVLSLRQALLAAEEAGVDLVEVAPEARPPVCRLLDYGKLKYREQKKAAETRKKSSVHTVKELRVRYNTDKHDIEIKTRNARKFLEEGDKVRFQMQFRGRETSYKELGDAVFRDLAANLEDIAIIEEMTPLLGRKMTMTIAPKTAAVVPPAKPAAAAPKPAGK